MEAQQGENRYVVLTPAGAAAIAVVRVVGRGAGPFLSRHFSKAIVAARCVHGELRDGERVIDDCVVVAHEHGADLNLHGGPWVVRSVLELLRREGFGAAGPDGKGPLALEAVDAADTIEAEVETWLPMARTELALRVLLAQPAAWGTLEGDHSPEVARRVLNDLSLYWLLNPPRVAIVGAANVGKSTLANQLFAQERSIVADVPGTTRDWVGELANVNGLAVMLVDTPGVRETGDEIEREAIERSREQVRRADLVVLVLDASRPIDGKQGEMLGRHPDALVVLNKVDRAAVGSESLAAVRTVASTGQGVEQLREHICRHFASHAVDPAAVRWWTPRQRAWLANHLADEG